MADRDFDTWDDADGALSADLKGAGEMATQFSAALGQMRQELALGTTGVNRLESSLSRGVRRAIDGVVLDGHKLSDVLGKVAHSLIDTAYSAAVRPVGQQVGGLLAQTLGSILTVGGQFKDGAGFSQGRVMPFAKGGVVSGPTSFPMRGATGLMGEAGPEAIMPLSRGADGSLGVRVNGAGGRPVNVVMNISTPDAVGFQRSQGQIATLVSRSLARAARNR